MGVGNSKNKGDHNALVYMWKNEGQDMADTGLTCLDLSKGGVYNVFPCFTGAIDGVKHVFYIIFRDDRKPMMLSNKNDKAFLYKFKKAFPNSLYKPHPIWDKHSETLADEINKHINIK